MICQTNTAKLTQMFLTTALAAAVVFVPLTTGAATDDYFADDVNQTQSADNSESAFTEFISWITGGEETEAATEEAESDFVEPEITIRRNVCVSGAGTVETKIDKASRYELTQASKSGLVARGEVIGFHTFTGLADGSYTLTAFNDSGFFESTVFSVSCAPEEEDEDSEPEADKLQVSCSVTPKKADIDQRVDWTGSAAGGVGSYRFQWRGDAYSNSSTAVSRFSSEGNKAGTVYVFDENGTRAAAQCTMTVETGEVKGDKTEKEPYRREIEEF